MYVWQIPGMEQVWVCLESAQTVVPPPPPHFPAVPLGAIGENIHPLPPMCVCVCVREREREIEE